LSRAGLRITNRPMLLTNNNGGRRWRRKLRADRPVHPFLGLAGVFSEGLL